MITQATVLLPCENLDDFPTHYRGDAAAGLWAALTALWHPALLSAIGKTPAWHPAGEPPASLVGYLFVLPEVARSYLPHGFLDDAHQEGAVVIEGIADRRFLVAMALEAIGVSEGASRELTDDFLALGFCRWQGELLTRRMRYSSHLDEAKFERATIAAAKAWSAGNIDAARSQLALAFSALTEARGQYYPVDAYLIDVLLVAPTTIGQALRDELQSNVPSNVLVDADTLQKMAQAAPESLAALRAGIESGQLGLIGGISESAELPLMSQEAIRTELRAAGKSYEKLLGRRPTVFGRRRFALTPVLPQILHECGFVAAWHVALDEGRFPQADRSKIRWEGIDGTSIDALAAPPLDAGAAETSLKLPEQLGNTMDNDFVATLMFAHWPGMACDVHRDLQRSATYGPVLGKFVTVEDYFRETAESSIRSKFSPDQYRSPFLLQNSRTPLGNPITKTILDRHSEFQRETSETISTMASLLAGKEVEESQPLVQFAAVLARADKPKEEAVLIVNPLNFARPFDAELSPESEDSARRFVATIPSVGFTWTAMAEARQLTESNAHKPVANDNVLRNEFCEVTISPKTGGIQSIYDLRTHGNRLSQQIAIRLPHVDSGGDRAGDPDESPYTTMIADAVDVRSAESECGAVVSRGRMVDPAGCELAKFSQAVSLAAGSRVIQIEFSISDFQHDFTSDPWNSYLACRFAWAHSDAELRRSIHGCSFASEARRLESADFIEISSGPTRTTILPAGLPCHRRIGSRMLDSLLMVRGETARTFQLGIGIEVQHPWRAAKEFALPPTTHVENAASPISGNSGWLFHVDSPNVAATHWSPLVESGRVIGFRVRLLETEGRAGRVQLRSFRPPASAVQTSISGEPYGSVPIDGDAMHIDLAAYAWVQIEAKW